MVLDHFFPVDLRVENEASSLIRAGFKVDILSIAPYTESKSIIYKEILVHQVSVSKFISKKMRGLAGMVPWIDIFIAKNIKRLSTDISYDIIHFHDLYTFGAAKRIKKFTSAKFVGDLHENYVDVLEDYEWVKKFPNRYLVNKKKWRRKELEYLSMMDKVIVVNQGMKKKTIAKNIPEKDIVIVENMLNTKLFDSYKLDDTIVNKFKGHFNLLYIGGFVSNRGLEHVIKGMSLLVNYKNIHLILVGDGTMMKKLQNMVQILDIKSNVHFEGWQDQDKMKSYMSISNAGLIPFKRTEQTDNSSPNKLFQYMYYKLPIISTDCTSIKNIIEKDSVGIVYESEDHEAFAESVLKLYNSTEESISFSNNAEKVVREKYNWSNNVKEMIDMYNNLN
jgi:glycosyltransferase involved in cell wall biosynthesis